MAVVPAVAQATTGRPSDGGLVTAVTSAATVAAELAMPGLLARQGGGRVFGVALVLLGVASLSHLVLGSAIEVILALSIVRGLGFGAAAVAGAVLVAELAPAHARGRAVGNMGLIVGLSSMVSPSVGLLLLTSFDARAAFVVAGAIALLGVPVVWGVRSHDPLPQHERPPLLRALLRASLLVPFLGLALLTATYGGLISFAPRMLDPSGWGSAATYFLVYGAARALTRWSGGHATDRVGYRRVLLLGMLAACIGMALLALSLEPLAVLASAVLYGGGCGLAQTAIFIGMLEHTQPGQVRMVGTLWNIAFDAGVSLGGAVLGVVAASAGYSGVLLSLPLLTVVALALLALAWNAPRAAVPSTRT